MSFALMVIKEKGSFFELIIFPYSQFLPNSLSDNCVVLPIKYMYHNLTLKYFAKCFRMNFSVFLYLVQKYLYHLNITNGKISEQGFLFKFDPILEVKMLKLRRKLLEVRGRSLCWNIVKIVCTCQDRHNMSTLSHPTSMFGTSIRTICQIFI